MSRIPLFTRGIIRNQPFGVYFLIALGVQYGVSFGFAVATWKQLVYWMRIFDTTILGTGALPVAWLTNNLEILLYGYRPFMQSSPPPDWVITLNFLLLGLPIATVISITFACYCKKRSGIERITLIVLLLIALINPGVFLYYRNHLESRNGYYPIAHAYPTLEVAAAWGDERAVEKMLPKVADANCMDASGHTLLFRLLHGMEDWHEPVPLEKRGFITIIEKDLTDVGYDQGEILPILLHHGTTFSASDLAVIRKMITDLSDNDWVFFVGTDEPHLKTERIALLFAVADMGLEYDNATCLIAAGIYPNFRFSFGGIGNRTLLHYAVTLDAKYPE